MRILSECFAAGVILVAGPLRLAAQPADVPGGVLERLARLEEDNRALRREIAELRKESAARAPAAMEERLEIQERRIEEHSQTKVEAGQSFPVRLSGVLVANVFHNGRHAAGLDTPVAASRNPGRAAAGLSFRQSIVGFEYRGPATLWGGQVHGSVFFDFFDGLAESTFPPARLRTAVLAVDWSTRSLSVGLDKPLFSRRDPSTFSYAGVSPLTGSGNLWRWQPQIRFEQRLKVSAATLLSAQAAVVQTTEESGLPAGLSTALLERRRPGFQGRLQIGHRFDETRRLEIAPAVHVSESHFAGTGLRSSLFALDFFANPWSRLELSGVFFTGQNVHHFGALRQSYFTRAGRIEPVRSRGGWGQFSVPLASRFTLNVFGGIHDDRNSDITQGGIGVNRTGAANIMYRAAPNVFLTLEALQLRTTYLGAGTKTNNRYDLAVAYLF